MNRRTFFSLFAGLVAVPLAASNISLTPQSRTIRWTPDQYHSTRFVGHLWFCWRDIMGIEREWRKANGCWGHGQWDLNSPTLLRLGRYECARLSRNNEWGWVPEGTRIELVDAEHWCELS